MSHPHINQFSSKALIPIICLQMQSLQSKHIKNKPKLKKMISNKSKMSKRCLGKNLYLRGDWQPCSKVPVNFFSSAKIFIKIFYLNGVIAVKLDSGVKNGSISVSTIDGIKKRGQSASILRIKRSFKKEKSSKSFFSYKVQSDFV